MNFIDLFSGAGGFSLGFSREGFKNILSIDIENSFCKTYKRNFPKHNLIQGDIQKISNDDIMKIIGDKNIDVIIGGPPCQGFSMAGNIGRKFIDDPRNSLYKEFVRIIDVVKPKFFVMENVARLYTHNNGKTKNEIIDSFSKIGYKLDVKVINTKDYNIPQSRSRVLFIGTLDHNINIEFPLIEDFENKNIFDAISDLPVLNSGESSEIPNHIAMNHSEQMLKKMSYISDGGDRNQIPMALRPKSGDIRKYIRYDSQKPSIAITGDMRKVFHYSQNRALTVRELARIQTFPDDFIFEGTSISQQQQVGNAVPPLLAQKIAKCIKKMLIGFEKRNQNRIFPKINYIGNKEKISPWICDYFPKDAKSIFDAFSGGSSIGYEAKKRGFKVISNDVLKINYLIAKALIENNNETLNSNDIDIIFNGKPFKGFMYNNYADVYFFPDECEELDLYKKNIGKLSSKYKKALAYTLLRRAMIRKMPYSRFNIQWEKVKQLRDEEWSYMKYKRKRAYHNQSFKFHFLEHLDEYNSAIFDNGQQNMSYNNDIFSILGKIKTDIIYLDPPYTGTLNNYFGFYGLLDSFIDGEQKEPFENNFINKGESLILFERLFSNLQNFKYWILSYNNNSHPSKEELINIIKKFSKKIQIIEKKHDYKVTGKDNKKKNVEYLFIIENEKYNIL